MKKLRLCSPAKAVRVMNGNATGDGNSTEIGAPPQGYAAAGKLMLGTIVALFLVVVAALFIHHYLQMAILRRIAASRRRRWRSGDETLNPSASPGLDPAVLESIPAVAVAGLKGAEGIECAVCLSEAAVGEMVRILPRCGHGFHVDCIDLWFGSHETCPVCRAPVEAVAPPPATEIDGLGSSRGAAAKGSVSGGLRRFGGAAPATPAAEPPDLERGEVAER